MEVLSYLNDLVQEWILELTLAKHISKDEANLVGGQIYTFGSYRLGVYSEGADIDALCVAPRHIDRNEFFTSFYEKLKNCSYVTELRVSVLNLSARKKDKFRAIIICSLFFPCRLLKALLYRC